MPEEGGTKKKESGMKNFDKIFGSNMSDKLEKFKDMQKTNDSAMEELSSYMNEYRGTIDSMVDEIKKYSDAGFDVDGLQGGNIFEKFGRKIPFFGSKVKPKSMYDFLHDQKDFLYKQKDYLEKSIEDISARRDDADAILMDILEAGEDKSREIDKIEPELIEMKEKYDMKKAKIDEMIAKDGNSTETREGRKELRVYKNELGEKEDYFNSLTTAINFTDNISTAFDVILEGLDVQHRVMKHTFNNYTTQLESLEYIIDTQASLHKGQETEQNALASWGAVKSNINKMLEVSSEGTKMSAKLLEVIMNDEYYDKETLTRVRENYKQAMDIMDKNAAENYKKAKGLEKNDEDPTEETE